MIGPSTLLLAMNEALVVSEIRRRQYRGPTIVVDPAANEKALPTERVIGGGMPVPLRGPVSCAM